MSKVEDPRPLVLIADDDEMMRSLMAATLSDGGFRVLEARDGEAAVIAFRAHAPDLVVLDVDMPIKDGFMACGHIRGSRQGRNTPVVMVTGSNDTESIDLAYEVGATDFVIKPVNWALFSHRIRYVLRGAETMRDLAQAHLSNRALLEALPDRIVVTSVDGTIHEFISRHETIEGAIPEDVAAYLPHAAVSRAMRGIGDVLSGRSTETFEYVEDAGKNGRRDIEVRVVPHTEGRVLLILRDVTERRRAEERIRRLAYYDSLTGMPNRHFFLKRLTEVLRYQNTAVSDVILLSIDLDQFKRVNNNLGHEIGDRILAELATRLVVLRNRLRSNGTYVDVARLDGDNFVVFSTLPRGGDPQPLVDRVSRIISEPLSSEVNDLVITASVGVARYPTDGNDIVTLMKSADRALYGAKAAGRDTHRYYSGGMEDRGLDRLTIERDLRRTLHNGELTLYFQPKVDLRTSALVGAEALLRWFHPELGLVSPAEFIPVAEETGLILDVDRWVMNRVCEYQAAWQAEGHASVPVAINLSGREFCFEDPVGTLQQAVGNNRVDPACLEIEITENVLMEDLDGVVGKLRALEAAGFKVAIDDFGTGYSSLSYLKQFPLDVLKIDRAFVSDVADSVGDRTLCRAMIGMAHGLGLKVVAEGIETEQQRKILLDEGCDVGQGYLFARPMNEQAFRAQWLSRLSVTHKDLSMPAPRSLPGVA